MIDNGQITHKMNIINGNAMDAHRTNTIHGKVNAALPILQTYADVVINVKNSPNIEFSLDFYSIEGLEGFLDNILHDKVLLQEKAIREQNPDLQRLWEEYQILLRLHK